MQNTFNSDAETNAIDAKLARRIGETKVNYNRRLRDLVKAGIAKVSGTSDPLRASFNFKGEIYAILILGRTGTVTEVYGIVESTSYWVDNHDLTSIGLDLDLFNDLVSRNVIMSLTAKAA